MQGVVVQTCTKCLPIGSLLKLVRDWTEDERLLDVPIEHSVKGSNLVDSHGRHTEVFCDVVHNADACPSFVLSLGEIEKRNDGGFFVLRGIFGNDFLGALYVLCIELEWDLRQIISLRAGNEDVKMLTLGLLYSVSRC